MGFSLGIVGLPNVGKSTLFNALSRAGAAASNYPFTTIEPNVGIVPVPDRRLNRLTEISKSAKTIPTAIEFVDIAGLVRGANKGEGLGNQFLANIREVDAIVHVVRCFSDPDVVHVEGDVDPKRDIEIIELELILADLATVEKRLDAAAKQAKSGAKEFLKLKEILERAKAHLEKSLPARTLPMDAETRDALRSLGLMTAKPVLYVANMDEAAIAQPDHAALKIIQAIAEKEGAGVAPRQRPLEVPVEGRLPGVVPISAKVEAELVELGEAEAQDYLASLGLSESGLGRLARAGYALLHLITYFTTGEDETRAWTITDGTLAPQAAGKIHSDFERGFICAETVAYEVLDKLASMKKAKETGQVRIEGKSYRVKDGDVMEFRFNV